MISNTFGFYLNVQSLNKTNPKIYKKNNQNQKWKQNSERMKFLVIIILCVLLYFGIGKQTFEHL